MVGVSGENTGFASCEAVFWGMNSWNFNETLFPYCDISKLDNAYITATAFLTYPRILLRQNRPLFSPPICAVFIATNSHYLGRDFRQGEVVVGEFHLLVSVPVDMKTVYIDLSDQRSGAPVCTDCVLTPFFGGAKCADLHRLCADLHSLCAIRRAYPNFCVNGVLVIAEGYALGNVI